MKGVYEMARNTKATCRSIMIDLQGRGFEGKTTRKEIMASIVEIAGETRSTRERYINALKRYGFVKQETDGLFTLNYSKVDDDSEMSLMGDLTRRVSRLEVIVAKLYKAKEA